MAALDDFESGFESEDDLDSEGLDSEDFDSEGFESEPESPEEAPAFFLP